MPKLPGFISGAYLGRSRAIDSQLCVNLLPEINQASSKSVIALIGTPGLVLDETVTPTFGRRGRGAYTSVSTGNIYLVIGDGVYKKTATVGATKIGSLVTNDGTVRFAENAAQQILIVDGQEGYYINTTLDTVTQILRSGDAAGFPFNPTHAIFIGGYFLVNNRPNGVSNGEFYWSAVDDATTWSALDFANAESNPDSLEGMIENRGELWLVGQKTKEVWYLTAEADSSLRFQLLNGTTRAKGTSAKYSLAQIQDSVFYLGSDREGHGIVWMSQGYELQQISTTAIEYQIRSYSDITDAVAFLYQFEGHFCYCLTFPTGKKTWVYDLSTGLWHEWSFFNQETDIDEQAKCIYQTFFNGKNYVLDRDNGNIYYLDLETYTDNGSIIRRVRSCPHIHNDRKQIFYDEFKVDIESGVGLTTGQGSDPQMILEISNDGGYSFGNELWQSMGKIGHKTWRTQWHRLGESRDRVFKITITDPIKVVLIDAHIEIELSDE